MREGDLRGLRRSAFCCHPKCFTFQTSSRLPVHCRNKKLAYDHRMEPV